MSKRILVIEDNPFFKDILVDQINSASQESSFIFWKQNLSQALSLLEKEHFDIILLDIILPDSSGIYTIDSIISKGFNIPIIIITSLEHENLFLAAIQMGAEGFIFKDPGGLKYLNHSINFAIERYKLRKKMILDLSKLEKTQKAALNLLEDLNQEIKERKVIEESLRFSEWKFKSLVECSTNGIVMVKEGKIIFANKAFSRIMHIENQILNNFNFMEFFFGNEREDQKDFNLFFQKIIFEGEKKDSAQTNDFMFKRNDGLSKWLSIQGVELFIQGEAIQLLNIMDITRMKETEFQLLQNEKLTTMGQLAAGVAHEINNPIGYIFSNLRMLVKYMPSLNKLKDLTKDLFETKETSGENTKDKKIGEIKNFFQDEELDYIFADIQNLLTESLDGVNKVSRIVNDIKSFARMDSSEAELSDINEIIESTLNIVWNQIKYDSQVEKDLTNDLPLVKCVARQISQALMNIIINASHAIEEKKRNPETAESYAGEIKIRSGLRKDWKNNNQDKVEIIVQDNGSGIPEAVREKIFNPFFTTKAEGKGTGLGMSITLDIIKKHHGDLQFESTVNQGTKFIILLPLSN